MRANADYTAPGIQHPQVAADATRLVHAAAAAQFPVDEEEASTALTSLLATKAEGNKEFDDVVLKWAVQSLDDYPLNEVLQKTSCLVINQLAAASPGLVGVLCLAAPATTAMRARA